MRSRNSLIWLASAVLALGLSTVPSAAAGSGASNTPIGLNVVVSPLVGVEIVFDNVLDPGLTTVVMTDLGPEAFTTPCGNAAPSFWNAPIVQLPPGRSTDYWIAMPTVTWQRGPRSAPSS